MKRISAIEFWRKTLKTLGIPLLAALIALPATASAANESDLRALREEVARLRETYEKRIDALEKRVVEAESKSAATALVTAKAEAAAMPDRQLRRAATPSIPTSR